VGTCCKGFGGERAVRNVAVAVEIGIGQRHLRDSTESGAAP
jgi:hypothetical protein